MARSRAKVAVVGVGHSRLFRRDDVALGLLAVEAARNAIDDAGLKLTDIDGLSIAPRQPFEGAGAVDGLNLVSPEFLLESLRLDVAWSERQFSHLGHSLIAAMNAVASGQCRYAICVRALHSPAGHRYGHVDSAEEFAADQFRSPYGAFAPGRHAVNATAHMDRYGSTREQLGALS